MSYEGDITKDSAAWRESGNRNDHLTRYLLRAGDTMILAGYGAGLRVERDALIVTEGRTHHPHQPLTFQLHRGLHNVSRIVCLDPQGSLSFAAAKWCRDEAITVTLLSCDGELLATLTPSESADAALRRCQYLAHERGTAVPIVRELLRRKFTAQLDTVMAVHTHLLEADRAMDMLRTAVSWFSLQTPPPWLSTIDQLRSYEGRAAAAYFSCWRSFRVRWARGDVKKIPPHWQFFDGRSSPITARGLPRHAIDPVNACLNYAYGVLESGVRQALTSQGFDVACGFLHADLKGRDSLVYDVMEPLRGMVDGLVLRFLSAHTLHYGDLTRVHDGSCRLHPQLARAVVAACKLPQETIEQQATWLRETVLSAQGGEAGAK
jgi:CRISP-associated protein Cas1